MVSVLLLFVFVRYALQISSARMRSHHVQEVDEIKRLRFRLFGKDSP